MSARELRLRRAVHAAIQRSPCTQCSANPGDPCRTAGGHLALVPHAVRREAAMQAGFYSPGDAR